MLQMNNKKTTKKLHVDEKKKEHVASRLKRGEYSILKKKKLLSYKQPWWKLKRIKDISL